MKIQTARKSGFTLVEIMIGVAIIGLLAAIAIPNFVRARTTAQKNACIANLRQIESAVQQWALENKKSAASVVTTADVTPFLKNNVMPEEPAGAGYTVSTIDAAPLCTGPASAGHTL